MGKFVVNKDRIAKNTIALYLRMAFTMVISFVAARVTLQQLGVDDYGLNNLVGSIVSLMSFLQTSIGTAIQRFYSIEIGKGNEEGVRKVFSTGLLIHLLICLFSLIVGEVFAVFFLEKMNIPEDRMFAAHVVFQVSVVTMLLNIVNIPYSALLRAKEQFDKIAIYDVIQAFLRLVILFLLVYVSFDKLILLSFLNFGITLFYLGAMTHLALKFKETHCHPSLDKEMAKMMMGFVSMLIISTLSSVAKTKGLVILVNLFFGLSVNAAYAVAVQVSNMVNTFVLNFKQSMVPQLMSSYGAGDKTIMHRIINFGTKITGLLMLFITLPVIVESEYILKLWLGTPPEYSAELVSLVLININISSLTFFHYQGIQATGKITSNQMVLTILCLLAIGGFYIAFKLGFGVFSAMYINMGLSILIVANGLFFSKNRYDYQVSYFIKVIVAKLLIVALITIGCLFIITKNMESSFIRLIITLGISTALVALSGYFLLFEGNERVLISDYIKKIINKRHK
jgi:O-antigen/teichoic acid export membrane protein